MVRKLSDYDHLTAFEDEERDREELCKKILFTGVPAIDEVVKGILPNDFMLIGAKTGSGKTEILSHIALSIAAKKKYVDFFALEASNFEIHRRIKYKAESVILQNRCGIARPSFNLWFRGEYKKHLEPYREAILAELAEVAKYLRIQYRHGSKFDLKHFTKEYHARAATSSLMLVDHAQFFDMDDSTKEIAHIKDMSLMMYDMVTVVRVPILLVSHLRKIDANQKIPTLNDFYGSSELVKKVTRALILSKQQYLPETNETLTIFNFEKNREGRPTALLCTFQHDTNSYSDKVVHGHVDNDRFEPYPAKSMT